MMLPWLAACTAALDTPVDADIPPDTTTPPQHTGAPDTDTDTDTVSGELRIEQLYVTGDDIAEAALLVGPDGTSVLIDVAGAADAPAVLEAVVHHLGVPAVDWVLLTHWHRDHVGGVLPLLGGEEPALTVRSGIITRGMLDVPNQTVHQPATRQACSTLEQVSVPVLALCDGDMAPCKGSAEGSPWPARGCPGLLWGDLSDPSDDGDGALSQLSLGDGAVLRLLSKTLRVLVLVKRRANDHAGADEHAQKPAKPLKHL